MDKAAKIKAGASIVAILVALLFLAFYFGLFGGGDAPPPDATPADLGEIPQQEIEEIEQLHQEELERARERGSRSVGS